MWEAVYDFIAPWGEAFELDVAQVVVRTVIVVCGRDFSRSNRQQAVYGA